MQVVNGIGTIVDSFSVAADSALERNVMVLRQTLVYTSKISRTKEWMAPLIGGKTIAIFEKKQLLFKFSARFYDLRVFSPLFARPGVLSERRNRRCRRSCWEVSWSLPTCAIPDGNRLGHPFWWINLLIKNHRRARIKFLTWQRNPLFYICESWKFRKKIKTEQNTKKNIRLIRSSGWTGAKNSSDLETSCSFK